MGELLSCHENGYFGTTKASSYTLYYRGTLLPNLHWIVFHHELRNFTFTCTLNVFWLTIYSITKWWPLCLTIDYLCGDHSDRSFSRVNSIETVCNGKWHQSVWFFQYSLNENCLKMWDQNCEVFGLLILIVFLRIQRYLRLLLVIIYDKFWMLSISRN